MGFPPRTHSGSMAVYVDVWTVVDKDKKQKQKDATSVNAKLPMGMGRDSDRTSMVYSIGNRYKMHRDYMTTGQPCIPHSTLRSPISRRRARYTAARTSPALPVHLSTL